MAKDRRQTKSKYTADRNIPGAFEGETVTRRRFMTTTTHAAGAIAASAFEGRGEDVFALRVRGESMIDAHICDGDLVLVRRQDSAQPNDIVVALVESVGGDGEATVKRFQRDGERVVLKPEHPTMAPIVVDPRERAVRILGKVIGLLRGIA